MPVGRGFHKDPAGGGPVNERHLVLIVLALVLLFMLTILGFVAVDTYRQFEATREGL